MGANQNIVSGTFRRSPLRLIANFQDAVLLNAIALKHDRAAGIGLSHCDRIRNVAKTVQ